MPRYGNTGTYEVLKGIYKSIYTNTHTHTSNISTRNIKACGDGDGDAMRCGVAIRSRSPQKVYFNIFTF